jgi:chromosome segregation ATPase
LEVVEKVVRNAKMEKSELQAQLRETISSYTEAIEKLHTQLASAQGGPTAAVQLQLHEARSQHSKLQLELQELRQKMEEEQQSAPTCTEAGNSSSEVEAMRGEIQQLRTRISALAGDQQDQSKRDLTRAEELRRLRADVDMLNSEKDALELNLVQAEKEKADLIDNFVHVKGCLDKLQMDSLMTPAASPEHERQVAQLKASYGQAVDERNRLAARADALDREREKQKQQRESALERVMNANARLLEERDKLEKEKARVSALYQSTMGAMGAVPQAGSTAGGAGGEERCDQAALDAMKADLAQKTELLTKREQEGESLRARLRKLAMV